MALQSLVVVHNLPPMAGSQLIQQQKTSFTALFIKFVMLYKVFY